MIIKIDHQQSLNITPKVGNYVYKTKIKKQIMARQKETAS